MLETVAAAFIVFALVIAGMAIGVMLQGKRITGSCGGLSAIDDVDECGVCGKRFDDPDVAACEGPPK